MYLAGIIFNGNRPCVGTTSVDKFYRSKYVPQDQGKGKIVMATVRLDIETEAFQINMETNTLMIPRLGITQTINKTNQFTIKNVEGTITSSLEDMPQDSCHQHKDVGQITVIKHEPCVSQPGKMCRVIRISAPNGIGETDGQDIFESYRLL